MSKLSLTRRNEVFNQQAEGSVVESRHDLSKCSSGSFRMGVLYPIYCRNDIVPGDKWTLNSVPFLRLLPMVAPALTSIDVEVRYFFVPRRILWSQWKQFISPSTADDVNLVEPFIYNREEFNKVPYIYNVAGSLYDYMGEASIPWTKTGGTNGIYGNQRIISFDGVPAPDGSFPYIVGNHVPAKTFTGYFTSNANDPIKMSAFPYLAYNAIWNEYFRDENLQDEALTYITTGGAHHGYHFGLRRVNWSKDYFTSALPWVTQQIFSTPTVNDGDTIEQLREASALTKWLELQAIGGHRYQESIFSHFGVRVPDEAAQIPVYLGGGKCPVQIQSVEQNSFPFDVHTDAPLGTLAGKATASDNVFIDKFMFKEHGTVIGVMYIRPRALYADVTPKDLFPKGRHDYYWPSFANLGDEAVKSAELNPGWFELDEPDSDYGYVRRYASMLTSFDQVHSQLRPLETLESWTQARSWSDVSSGTYENVSQAIQVNSDFITCRPSNRIFADTNDVDNIVGDVVTLVDAIRPLPSYVNPKID